MNAPESLGELQRRTAQYARQNGLTVNRVQQRIFSEVFCGLLEVARAQNVIPLYVVKGGMAMEIRFGTRARASRDLDVGLLYPVDELLPVFDLILALGFDRFSFRRQGIPRLLSNARTYRIDVPIQYMGSLFGVLQVDLNEATSEPPSEVVSTGVLTELGLPGPIEVLLLEEYTQIAHKIHGATEPSTKTYQNERFRDVVDVLVATDERTVDYKRLGNICFDEFNKRAKHEWPTYLSLDDVWKRGVADEARKARFKTTDPDELARTFNDIILRATLYTN